MDLAPEHSITAPVATRLIQSVGVLPTFAYLGVGYFIMTIIAGLFMQNPPDGYQPPGCDSECERNRPTRHA